MSWEFIGKRLLTKKIKLKNWRGFMEEAAHDPEGCLYDLNMW